MTVRDCHLCAISGRKGFMAEQVEGITPRTNSLPLRHALHLPELASDDRSVACGAANHDRGKDNLHVLITPARWRNSSQLFHVIRVGEKFARRGGTKHGK